MSYSITTKGGDKGQTSIYSGERFNKDDKIFDVIGDLDELNSFLGIIYSSRAYDEFLEHIDYIQNMIFYISTEIATSKEFRNEKNTICKRHIDVIEKKMKDLESKFEMPNGFVISGGTSTAAHLDVCRAIARRVERKSLSIKSWIENENALIWLNRLSDYLWLLARFDESIESRSRLKG